MNDLKIKGFVCSYCGEWIIMEMTKKKNTYLSNHQCKEMLKNRRFGIMTGMKR